MNNMQTEQRSKLIIDAISEEIAVSIKSLRSEKCYPAMTPDASDDFIKRSEEKILKLRTIREDLEEIL